jgi:hypothetical protein
MRKTMLYQWIVSLVAPGLFFGCTGHYFRNDADAVRFYLRAPEAAQVEFVASLNGFEPLNARRTHSGNWMVAVPNNRSFTYFYRVDGQVRLPDCDVREHDDFGRFNCLFQHTP